jgi:hypothetical protein
MWESSAPLNSDSTSQLNRQLLNSRGNTTTNEQAFQTCRSIINRFNSQSSDDDQILSDEDDGDDDDEQGGRTPRGSKKKGPHSLVLQLNVHNIHLAANAPLVSLVRKRSKLNCLFTHSYRERKFQENLVPAILISVNFGSMGKV